MRLRISVMLLRNASFALKESQKNPTQYSTFACREGAKLALSFAGFLVVLMACSRGGYCLTRPPLFFFFGLCCQGSGRQQRQHQQQAEPRWVLQLWGYFPLLSLALDSNTVHLFKAISNMSCLTSFKSRLTARNSQQFTVTIKEEPACSKETRQGGEEGVGVRRVGGRITFTLFGPLV